jgi:hypothetical protein
MDWEVEGGIVSDVVRYRWKMEVEAVDILWDLAGGCEVGPERWTRYRMGWPLGLAHDFDEDNDTRDKDRLPLYATLDNDRSRSFADEHTL